MQNSLPLSEGFFAAHGQHPGGALERVPCFDVKAYSLSLVAWELFPGGLGSVGVIWGRWGRLGVPGGLLAADLGDMTPAAVGVLLMLPAGRIGVEALQEAVGGPCDTISPAPASLQVGEPGGDFLAAVALQVALGNFPADRQASVLLNEALPLLVFLLIFELVIIIER